MVVSDGSQSACAATPSITAADDGLRLQIFFKPKNAELAPVARLLVTAEGQTAVEWSAVKIDSSCPDAIGDFARANDIAGLHETCQSERGVIGDADRFILAVVTHERQYRTEDLFARNPHLRPSRHRTQSAGHSIRG